MHVSHSERHLDGLHAITSPCYFFAQSLRQSMESLVTADVYLARNSSTGVVPTKSAEASR